MHARQEQHGPKAGRIEKRKDACFVLMQDRNVAHVGYYLGADNCSLIFQCCADDFKECGCGGVVVVVEMWMEVVVEAEWASKGVDGVQSKTVRL